MQSPGKRDDERDQHNSANGNESNDEDEALPMHDLIPAPLRKILLASSCCTGVAVLYAFSSWDHGWIPGLESQFADAKETRAAIDALNTKFNKLDPDLAELYTLSIARAIRDLYDDICVAPTPYKSAQLDALQYKYKVRTGERYPYTDCRRP